MNGWSKYSNRNRRQHDKKNLLVELQVEELPPKSLKQLGGSFAEFIASNLQNQGFIEDAINKQVVYASPRRLAVWVADVAVQAADKPVSQKLMPVKVGLDANGQATPPLLKKLASLVRMLPPFLI